MKIKLQYVRKIWSRNETWSRNERNGIRLKLLTPRRINSLDMEKG